MRELLRLELREEMREEVEEEVREELRAESEENVRMERREVLSGEMGAIELRRQPPTRGRGGAEADRG